MHPIRFQWQWLSKLILLFILAVPSVCSAVVARLETSFGLIDVQLYDTGAPLTVANFLTYVKSKAYDNSFFHRNVPGFVLQGGGFTWDAVNSKIKAVPSNAPVVNEFDISRSNVRGTIAMAKIGADQPGGGPDSATNQWFFNLANNASNLDNQNGGFTVFGKVVNSGMSVVDTIAALPIYQDPSPSFPFPNLPIDTSSPSNLVIIKKITTLPATSKNSDRIFAYLESLYPDQLKPYNSLKTGYLKSKSSSGYYYRNYPASSKKIVAVYNGKVYWGNKLSSRYLTLIGSVTQLLKDASKNGF